MNKTLAIVQVVLCMREKRLFNTEVFSMNRFTEDLTWVPTLEEIDRILKALLGIDVINRWKKYRRNSRYGE